MSALFHPFDETHLALIRDRVMALEFHATGEDALRGNAQTRYVVWRAGEREHAVFSGPLRDILGHESAPIRFADVAYFRAFAELNPRQTELDGDLAVVLDLAEGQVRIAESRGLTELPERAVFWLVTRRA